MVIPIDYPEYYQPPIIHWWQGQNIRISRHFPFFELWHQPRILWLSTTFLSPTTFKCKICNTLRSKAMGSGYTNMVSHLDAKHDYFREKYDQFLFNPDATLESLGFINTQATNMARWTRWIIECKQPFCDVNKEETRRFLTLTHVTSKSSMCKIVASGEESVSLELPKVFGISLDGWSDASVHYVGVQY